MPSAPGVANTDDRAAAVRLHTAGLADVRLFRRTAFIRARGPVGPSGDALFLRGMRSRCLMYS